jgi:Tfp pilus assembly protein PilX
MDKNKGFVLTTLLFTTLFLSFVVMYASSLALSFSNIANREIHKVNAQMAADAGIDQALNLLNTQGVAAFSGPELNETELLNAGKYKTTYTKSISDGANENEKTLIVVGRTYAPATSTKIAAERKFKVDIKAVTSENSPASVVSGVGGLILNTNSDRKSVV